MARTVQYTSSSDNIVIRGKKYTVGDTFVCYASGSGRFDSEGATPTSHVDAGQTCTFGGYAVDAENGNALNPYPYLIRNYGWFKEDIFPYTSYTVTYNANGGRGTMASSTATYGQSFITRKNTFTRTGYTFAGWNEKADGSGTAWGITSSDSGTYESGNSWVWSGENYQKNITLYAQWTINTATIRYHVNGGTGGNDTYSINKTLIYKDGHVFSASWYYGQDTLNLADIGNSSIYGITKIGHHIEANSAWRLNGANGTTITSNSTTDSTTLGYFNDLVKSSTDVRITMYANWIANIATVRYHVNGGTINSDTYQIIKNLVYTTDDLYKQTWSYGKTTLDLANASTFGLTKTGYHIIASEAWRLNSTSGTAITHSSTTDSTTLGYFNDLVKSSTDVRITMYANWIANTYTVNYNGNGSTEGSTANSSHIYDKANTLTANGFTRIGYKFICWNTKADGSGTNYEDQESVVNLTTTNEDTIVLYAQWEPLNVAYYKQDNQYKLCYTYGKIDNVWKHVILYKRNGNTWGRSII